MKQVDRFKKLPDNARIQAMGNLFKYNDRLTWDIGVRIDNSTRQALKFSQLPYLSRQVVLNQTVAATPPGFPVEFILPDNTLWQLATVKDCGLVKFKAGDEQSQYCFMFESEGKTIYLPQLELARALFFTNNYFANAALVHNALDFEFDVEHDPSSDNEEFPLDVLINALPTTNCPKILFDNEGFRYLLAWVLLDSDVKSSFESIYKYFSQELIKTNKFKRWTFRFDPPQLKGVKTSARGWKSPDGNLWFINRIEALENLSFPDIADIGYFHPNFTENKPGSSKGTGGTYPQVPSQREIDEESDGSSDNESALIFCDATQRIYNRVPRTRKVYAKSRKNLGGKEDEDKPDTLPPDVSTDDPNSRGDTPRAAIDGLDDQTDNADLYLSKFDGFFRMLEILEQEHGVKQGKPIVRKLPEIGRSKSHLMDDGSPRCMTIVSIEHQSEGYFLLEVDTSDNRASIATKVISARSLATKGKLRDFILEIEQGLLSNQFCWSKKYFDMLVGESSHKSVSHQKAKKIGRQSDIEIDRWMSRFFTKIVQW
ncbi:MULTISPECIES: Tn7-like element transposition protein TnsE [Pseudoalteromonas]|uniref:Tn7-like element transposition protein TnsE n=1 Tax=Pseudoalteromonas TaxID=53246 RepID=UPI000C5CE0F3|nr:MULTISPECIES: Tn7-like element transposition protein TnsE [Pseudoalteromonas]MAY59190.1 transposase [Pseudoalteromonas sp.]MDN3409042.1 Tn7-like element transposition protein TnsE [Pseudoalteromonas sp. APC 3894]MDN3416562.1 Tn7-like element transposition protein TnsE [Pseudoalteromonas sp. APC 3227]MDN3420259.1 Tn7-like element transposition protein TnsE [Pseudoalteromonas sp. APC 3895]MDN3423718.1 Tn7-like element transposition protein TnsE [Pseudoalteromonas sp. APC 3896]|tara:strand:+ start:42406 stop:44028 length:1623 start_codon:yes stop_codon:yes gene_type:complete